MSNRLTAARAVLLSLLLTAMLAAKVHAADATADAAEAAAAMERAKRQAASPLRVIMEANKVRRKGAAVLGSTAPIALVTGQRADVSAAQAPVATAPTRTLPSEPAPAATNESRPLDMPAPAAVVAAVPVPVPVLVPMPMPMPSVAPPATALREATVQPRLVEMVEPAVPQRVLDDIGRAVELNVDITIRADGSVASVAVLQPAPRTLIRYVVAAIERWRFEPLPGGLVHRVQVLFNDR